MRAQPTNNYSRHIFWKWYIDTYLKGHRGYHAHKPDGTDPMLWATWLQGTASPVYKNMPGISAKMGIPSIELITAVIDYAPYGHDNLSVRTKTKQWRHQVLKAMAYSVSDSVHEHIKKYLQSGKTVMPDAVTKSPHASHDIKLQAPASTTRWRFAKQKYWDFLVRDKPVPMPSELIPHGVTQAIWDTWKTSRSMPTDDIMGTILHALNISFKDGWGLYEFLPAFSEGIPTPSSSAISQKRRKYFNSWPDYLRCTTIFNEVKLETRRNCRTARVAKKLNDDLAYAEECRNNLAELRAQPVTEDVKKQIELNEANLRDAMRAPTLIAQDKARRAEWKEFQATRGAPPKYTIAPEEEDEPVVLAPAKSAEEPVATPVSSSPLPLTTPLNKIRLPLIDLIPEDSPHHPFTCQEKIEALIAGKPVGDTAKRRDWWRSPTSDPYKDAYSKASTAYTALNDAALDLVGWAKALKHYYEEHDKLVAQLPDPDMAGERKFRVPKHLEQVLMSGVVIINDEGLPEISPFAVLL